MMMTKNKNMITNSITHWSIKQDNPILLFWYKYNIDIDK